MIKEYGTGLPQLQFKFRVLFNGAYNDWWLDVDLGRNSDKLLRVRLLDDRPTTVYFYKHDHQNTVYHYSSGDK